MILKINREEASKAIHHYYKNVKGYNISEEISVKMPKIMGSKDITFELKIVEDQKEDKKDKKK